MGYIYQDYLQSPHSMIVEEMAELYQDIIMEIGTEEDALDLYEELEKQAVKYLIFRLNWVAYSLEEKVDHDAARTLCHDTLIVKFNQLARYLKMAGKAASWREALGDEKSEPSVRKRIGDFGCYIGVICALNQR